MSDISCPRCRCTKYKYPSLKFMVNVCGHPLCEPCVDMLFVRGQGNCETCHITLRKNNFRYQQFESAEVEKYIEVRKKMSKIYNKFSTDFQTLREYNDYLEEVETIAHNLTYDIDVEETKMKMECYRQENQEQIRKNLNKKSPEEEELDRMIEEEQRRSQTFQQKKIVEEKLKLEKQKKKNDILNDFIYSDLSMDEFMKNQEELEEEEVKVVEEEKVSKFSSGISIGKQDIPTKPVVRLTNGAMNLEEVRYKTMLREMEGPAVPSEEELISLGYLSKVRQVNLKEAACGFRSVTMCERALSDAYNGLFIFQS